MNTESGYQFHVTQFSGAFCQRVQQHGRNTGTALYDDRVAGLDVPHRLRRTNVFRGVLWGHRGHINYSLR